MAIHIGSAGRVATTAPPVREDRHVERWDGPSLKLGVSGPNACVQHIYMCVLTGDAKVVIASVKAHLVIDAVKAPEQVVCECLLLQPSLSPTQPEGLHSDNLLYEEGA